MRITESQLRRIVRQEILREAAGPASAAITMRWRDVEVASEDPSMPLDPARQAHFQKVLGTSPDNWGGDLRANVRMTTTQVLGVLSDLARAGFETVTITMDNGADVQESGPISVYTNLEVIQKMVDAYIRGSRKSRRSPTAEFARGSRSFGTPARNPYEPSGY